MDISDKELAQLVTKSGPVRLADSNFLRSLGLDVYQVLMADSIKSADLEIKLNDSVNSFGGLSIARIRFNVDKQTHPIHLETLAKPDESLSAPGYWMLRTPMFRKFGDRGERPPLFKDGRSRVEPVDCLVIQGCSTEFAVGDPLLREYKPLPAAESEARWLVDWLGEQGREIGAVTLLRHADHEPGRFAEAIRQALAARPYGLVHYCGHSEVDENDDESAAYLVLGEDDRDLVLVEDFAGWATSVQFMFLSSCHSANSLFIMKLVQAKVPAVAGYAWPMEDAVARRFSEAFYTCLFSEGRDKRYLEYSFMQAKRALHKQYRSKGHWVAPLLFMQVLDQVTA